jgi:hypothetical protein
MRSSPDAPPWLPRLARAAQCTPICGSARVGMLALEIAVRGCGICGSLLARCSHCRSRHPCWLALSEALTGLRMVILLSSGILLRSDDRRRSSLSRSIPYTLYCPFAYKWRVVLVTHCPQIYIRKEIYRPSFLDVNRYSFRNSIDLRRVFFVLRKYFDV